MEFAAPVEVGVRFRPVLASDDPPSEERVRLLDSGQLTVEGHVFDVSFSLTEGVSQQQLYSSSIESHIALMLQGYNVAVVAFGQTGAGKSYTLLGPDTLFAMCEMDFGIIPRSVRHIFSHLNSLQRSGELCDYAMSVHVSYLEINDEQIIDLLSYDQDRGRSLSVQTNDQGGVNIPGLTKLECCSVPQVLGYLASPLLNSASSVQRANRPPSSLASPSLPVHTVFSVHVQQQWCDDVSSHSSFGTVHFVDLCGSELRPVADDPEDFTIDTGLLALKDVADALCYPTEGGVPYDSHPLTSVLREVFGGNCKTMFLCCIAPADTDESLNALQYTNHVRAVSNWVHPNVTSCPLRTPSLPGPAAPGTGGTQVPLAPVCVPRLVNPVPPFQHHVQSPLVYKQGPLASRPEPQWTQGAGAYSEEQHQFPGAVGGDGAANLALIRQVQQQAVSSPPLTELSGQRAALHESLLADLYQRIQLLEMRQLTAAASSTADAAGERATDPLFTDTREQDKKQESDKEETLFQLQFAAEQYRQLVLSAEQLLSELANKPSSSTKPATSSKSRRTAAPTSSKPRSQESSRIQEWLYRKQETDACLSGQSRTLGVPPATEITSCSSPHSSPPSSPGSGGRTDRPDGVTGIIVASTPLLVESKMVPQTLQTSEDVVLERQVDEEVPESRDCSTSPPPLARIGAGCGGSSGRRRRQACTEHDLRLLRDSEEVKTLQECADHAQAQVNDPDHHLSQVNDPAHHLSRVNDPAHHLSRVNDPVLSSVQCHQDDSGEIDCSSSDSAAIRRQIEKLRECREQLHSQRHTVSLKCRDGSLDSVTVRRLLQLEESVHAVDDVIEQKNLLLLDSWEPGTAAAQTEAAQPPAQLIKLLSPAELAALYCRSFIRLVDCRVNGREKDIIVAELDNQVDGQNNCLKQLRRMVEDLMRERAHYKRQRDQLRSQLHQQHFSPSRQLHVPQHQQQAGSSAALQQRYGAAAVVDTTPAQTAPQATTGSLRNTADVTPASSQRAYLRQRLLRGIASSHTSAQPSAPTNLSDHSCQQVGGFSRVTRQQGGRVVIEAAALPTSTERRYRR